MKLPRDVSGTQLVKALRVLGYEVSRQRGSHVRLTTQRGGEHHSPFLTMTHSNPVSFRLFSRVSRRIIE